MTYDFRITDRGGQFAWIRWRNTMPIGRLPDWVETYRKCFWGKFWLGSIQQEQAWRELIEISEDLGLYD